MRFANSISVKVTGIRREARRRVLSGTSAAAIAVSMGAIFGVPAHSQVAVPKYQSPIQAPRPQVSLPAPAPVTANGTVVEYPIVRVNDGIIDNSDYERARRQLLAEGQQANVSPTELAQREKDLLRDMIDQQLLLSRGKELDINADSEVIRRLDEIRKQNHLDSMEALEKAVRESGVSFEDFKANIKNSVVTQEVVRDEVGRNLRLSTREEQAYYDQHKQEFEQPEQVRLSEILIPTPDDASDAQVAQAQAKANEVIAKLKTGEKFEDLVKQYSGGPNPETGGDLGDFKRGALGSKALEDPTFALKAGEWTAPIRTRQGFVILKVTEHNPAGTPPLKDVEEQVQQAIYAQAIQPALRTYLTKLREDAFIDITPGFIDTGASPKQTKPVFAGATPPPVKKKKNEKGRINDARNTGSQKVPAATSGAAGSTPPAAPVQGRNVSLDTSKKRKKIKREKIRFGQAPRNSLPEAPEETLAAGKDQGAGATSSAVPASVEASVPADQNANVAENVDPLAPNSTERKKTRFSDRQATEKQTKAAAKAAKIKQKAIITPAPMTAEEIATQKAQSAPLGLAGDTATKQKKKKVKGAPKERIQNKAPAPPAPKPEATPIPPKSVRDNGEPLVKPAPEVPAASNAPGDTTPTTSAPPQ